MVYTLKILVDTILKQQPIDSSKITDPRLKYNINGGAELILHSWKKEGNHLRAAFAETSFNGLNTWYAYSGHVEIWQDGKPLTASKPIVKPKASRLKFGIDMGHNASPDTGARGIAFEDTLTREVGYRVISKLRNLGHTAVSCTPSRAYSVIDSLRRRVQIANVQKVNYYVSIHFNAFNGSANGTEVFAVSDSARRIAQPVLNNLVSLGFVNRRVKNGSHLYVLKNTNMPAILIECCFIDSRRDMNIFNAEATANAIVRGLTGQNPTAVGSSSLNAEADEFMVAELVADTGQDLTLESFPSNAEQEVTLANFQNNLEVDETILQLQKHLNKLRIKDQQGKSLPEDGVLDSSTEYAICQFNEIVGLGDFKAAGAATWDALEAILEQPILRVNHADGPAVQYVQYRLGMEPEGEYNQETAEVVVKFQKEQDLPEEGIFGEESWDELLG